MTAHTIVVTGASSGIGRATARLFAARGHRLVLVARGADRLQATADECREAGAQVLAVVADVLDDDAVRDVARSAEDAFDGVDVVVHAAGVMAYGRIEDVPAEVFSRVTDTMIHGTASVARAFLPGFRQHGRGTLIVVNSVLGSVAVPRMGAYIAAKWGQLGLLRVLAQETRDVRDVRVCIVSPGAVDTPIYRLAANYAGHPGSPPPPVYSAHRVAESIVRCADHPRRHVTVGVTNPAIVLGFRLVPWVYDRLVGPLSDLVIFGKDRFPPDDGNVFAPDSDESAGRPTPSPSPETTTQHF